MSNGFALRQFTRSAFRVDVNPLVVGGRLGELIDTFLCYFDPGRRLELLTDEARKVFRFDRF